MKKLTILIIVALFFSSCKDTIVNNSSNNNIFSGKIENWHYGNNKDIIAIATSMDTSNRNTVIDSTKIDSSGNFTLTFNIPPDSILSKIYYGSNWINNISVNPSTARFSTVYLEIHDSGTNVGILFRSSNGSNPPVPGQCNVYFFYCDRSCSIIGKDSIYSGEITENWNCNFQKGWNNIYVLYNNVIPNNENLSITSSQSLTFKWYYTNFLSDDKLIFKNK